MKSIFQARSTRPLLQRPSLNVLLIMVMLQDSEIISLDFSCSKMVSNFFAGLIADKLASYEFAFYTAGSMMLFSAAVQFLLICFKSTANETKREEINVAISTDSSEEMSEQSQHKENDHKEYLSRLYVESTLRKNCKMSASVESMQLL